MSKDFSNLLSNAIAGKASNEISIRERIVIRKEFKELIPPLAEEEISQLEENILKEGVRDPLVLWPVGEQLVLIDGHNRFSVCQKHSLDFPFKKVEFKDEEEVRDWMVKNQLGRRNLSQEQQSYLRGLRYNREKSQGKRSDLETAYLLSTPANAESELITLDQNDLKSSTESTALKLSKEYNVSEATIKRDGEFAAGVDKIGQENPTLKSEILKGHAKISKQEIRSMSKRKASGKVKSKSHREKLTPEQVASIAFDFLKNETRSLNQVCIDLAEDENQIKPLSFFTQWSKQQANKNINLPD